MRSKIIWLTVYLFLWLLTGAAGYLFAEGSSSFSKEDVKNAHKRSEEMQKKITIPDYQKMHPEAVKAAERVNNQAQSPEFRKQVESMQQELQKQLEGQHPEITGYRKYAEKMQINDEKSDPRKSLLEPDQRLYILISSSMSKSMLRTLVADANKIEDPNVRIIMRGFVGGITYFKPTLQFITSLLTKDPNCNIMAGSQCETYNIGIDIDPEIFTAYDIHSVPTFIYARGITLIDKTGSEGDSKNATYATAYKISGDCSLDYALEQLYLRSKAPQVLALQKKLRKGFY